MDRLSPDDLDELRYIARKGLAYPKVAPGTDAQLDRLAECGLVTHVRLLGWKITAAGLAALTEGEQK